MQLLASYVSAAGPLDRKTARAPQPGRAPTCIGDDVFGVGLLTGSDDEVVSFGACGPVVN